MTTDKLQQAISLIKSGDRNNGGRLLSEVLTADPRNELAWLWMSTIAPADKRRYCLEKALAINPNNAQARQQLEKLSAPPPVQAAVPEPPRPMQTVAPAAPPPRQPIAPSAPPFQSLSVDPAPDLPVYTGVAPRRKDAIDPRFWVTPNKYMATIIHMSGDDLIAFDVNPQRGPAVVAEIKQGLTPKGLPELKKKFNLQSVHHVPISQVTSAVMFSETIKVRSVDPSGREHRASIDCDKNNAETVFSELQSQLGDGFQRTERPISRARVLGSSLLLFLLAGGGTAFFYFMAQGLQGEDRINGSALARLIGNLLLLLGPNGVLCIGGVLCLLLLIAFISSMAKPPIEHVLQKA